MPVKNFSKFLLLFFLAPFFVSCSSTERVSADDAATCEEIESSVRITYERLLGWPAALGFTSDGKFQLMERVPRILETVMSNTNSEISELIPKLKSEKTVARFTDLQATYEEATKFIGWLGENEKVRENVLLAAKKTGDFYEFCGYSFEIVPYEFG
jgi:hypothetical protein